MILRTTRRRFLQASAAGGAALGLGDLGFLARLPLVCAAETAAGPKVVSLQPEIEPLVRLIEETPREELLEAVAARIHRGISYQDILAALLLAGVRNVQPRPEVGFKFHAVLVVNSAHLAAMSSPDEHRWLPIFWALDYFKTAQAQDIKEGDWTMAPVDESSVPAASKARAAFTDAMDNWNENAADAAVAALGRSAGAAEVFEAFFRYGARDFRSIGHKAIFVANSMRTLSCIGWHHSEPVLRSLAYALLMRKGANPAQSDLAADRPGRRNAELLSGIRADWQDGEPSDAATVEFLAALRTGSYENVCDKVVELVNRKVAPQSIWDALHLGAGELLMRQPGIVALHAVTSTNALHHSYRTTGNDETRRFLLLQNAAFLTLFRESMNERGKVSDIEIDKFEAGELKESNAANIEDIFGEVSNDRLEAARKVLAYGQQQRPIKEFIDAARVLVFLKGDNSHDYKFSSALLEDYYNVSSGWRDRYLASGVFSLRGSQGRDNKLVERTRAALKA